MAQVATGPPEPHERHAYIARSPICLDAAGEREGNGLFTTHAFEAGEVVSTTMRPLLASLECERLRDTCANCFVWTEGSSLGSRLYVKKGTTVQACAGCKRFKYCSKACQKQAWARGHKHECKNLRSVADKELPKAVLGCMELLVRKKHGLISDEVWGLLCRLNTHIEDFKRNGKYGGIELMAMGTSQFSFTQDTFDKGFVAAMYARILSNSLTLITPSLDPLGIMLDPFFCFLNHSCDPNAYVIMDGPQIQLRTLKDIGADKELFISYIDPTNPLSRRQHELKERWFFDCKCSKCQKGPIGQEDVFIVDLNDAPQKFKQYADSLLSQGESPVDDAAAEALDHRRIVAFEGELFKAYEEQAKTADIGHAIKISQNAIELGSTSGIWPAHRQPLPALRDDLIVNLLAAERYELAWAHCAKRYRDTTEKLFEQKHHPVRVVQNWQMAMLAAYLASLGKQLAPGVDMGFIALMLINQVSNHSRMSHGANSAFSKSVREKHAEVMEEVPGKFGGVGAFSLDAFNAATDKQHELLLEMADWVKS